MHPVIVVHYHEIALKGRNRDRFERQLIGNLQRALEGIGIRVQRMSGRLVLRGDAAHGPLVRERAARVFGIANLGVGYEVRQDREGLCADVIAVLTTKVPGTLLRKVPGTFAVRVKRGNKAYPETSMDLERRLGAAIVETTGRTVNLEQPDLTVAIEIVEDTAFVLLEKIAGHGGLPVGISGRVVALLSSGFDSPVASWRMMKRGCAVIFVHFHSYPYTSDASLRNVRDIVTELAAWQGPSVLITVPLIEFQKAVMVGAPHALRVLLYRRAMVRVAELIAHAEGATALVTGENLGQVASQTIPNLIAVAAVTPLLIFRPLIGYDKQEIIAEAERINTAAISTRPYDDCCSLFTPAHPATAARAEELDRVERELGLLEWTRKVFDQRERETIAPSSSHTDTHT